MKKKEIVSNAGPLIFLSILGKIHLLKRLFTTVYIPQAVFEEVVLTGKDRPGEKEITRGLEEGWLVKVKIKNKLAVEGMMGKLHRGETEAIVLAKELGNESVILDDLSSREKARTMNLKVTGTIGILMLAKKEGVELNLRKELDKLIEHGFRISEKLYQKIIAVK